MPTYKVWKLPYADASAGNDPSIVVWPARRIVWDVLRKVLRIGDGATVGGIVIGTTDRPRRKVTFSADVTVCTIGPADSGGIVEVDAATHAGRIHYDVALSTAAKLCLVDVCRIDVNEANTVAIGPNADVDVDYLEVPAQLIGASPYHRKINQKRTLWSDGTNLRVAP